MTRPVHAFVLGVALSILGQAASATALEQSGNPESSISTMHNYGVGAPATRALRTVVPKGWETFVHPAANISGAQVNWKVGQAWTDVLEQFAKDNGLSIRVNWDEKSVFVRTPEIALEEGATRAELMQGATTPIPKFGEDVNKAAAKGESTYAVSLEAAKSTPAPFGTAGYIGSTKLLAEFPASAAPASQLAAETQNQQVAAKPAEPTAAAPTNASAPIVASAPAAPAAVVVASATGPAVEKAKSGVEEPFVSAAKESAVTAPVGELRMRVITEQGTAQASLPSAAQPAPAAPQEAAPALIPLKETAVAAVVPATTVTQVQASQVAASLISAGEPSVNSNVDTVAAVAPALRASPDFIYTKPVALNKPLARKVAQGIAHKFHLRLMWAAPEVQLKGPVTLLGNSADEDVALLAKALGLYSDVVLEVPPGSGVLRVTSRSGEYPLLLDNAYEPASQLAAVGAADSAPAALVAAADPAPASTSSSGDVPGASGSSQVAPVALPAANSTQSIATVDATVAPASVASAAVAADKEALSFVVYEGEQLEHALNRFANSKGYTVAWQVPGGFEAAGNRTYTGESVADVLSKVLPQLGVSADIYKSESHIIVRPVDPAIDR